MKKEEFNLLTGVFKSIVAKFRSELDSGVSELSAAEVQRTFDYNMCVHFSPDWVDMTYYKLAKHIKTGGTTISKEAYVDLLAAAAFPEAVVYYKVFDQQDERALEFIINSEFLPISYEEEQGAWITVLKLKKEK